MLKMTKNATLTGRSMINGQEVCYMSASVGDNNYFNSNISNFELYMSNMAEVMQDMQNFSKELEKLKKDFPTPKPEEEKPTLNDIEKDLSGE